MQKSRYARQMLDQAKSLDNQLNRSYYDMGRALSAIEHGGLYDVLGYETMGDLIDKELTVSRSTAHGYINLYRNFRRLHYTRNQAMEMLRTYGYKYMAQFVRQAKQKVGKRAIDNWIRNMKADSDRVVAFWLSPANHQKTISVLCDLGATPKDARLDHSSDAFMKLVDFYRERQQQPERKTLRTISGGRS